MVLCRTGELVKCEIHKCRNLSGVQVTMTIYVFLVILY